MPSESLALLTPTCPGLQPLTALNLLMLLLLLSCLPQRAGPIPCEMAQAQCPQPGELWPHCAATALSCRCLPHPEPPASSHHPPHPAHRCLPHPEPPASSPVTPYTIPLRSPADGHFCLLLMGGKSLSSWAQNTLCSRSGLKPWLVSVSRLLWAEACSLLVCTWRVSLPHGLLS